MWVHVIVLKINTVIQEADESLHSGFNCSSSWEVAWESLHVVYKWHQSKHKVWREAEQKHVYKMMSQQLHTPTLHLLWSLHLSTCSASQPFLFFLSHCPSIYFLKNVFLPPTMSHKDGGMRSVSLEEEKSYENIIVKWQWHLGKERKLKKVLGDMSQPLQAIGSFVKSSSSFLLCSLVVVSAIQSSPGFQRFFLWSNQGPGIDDLWGLFSSLQGWSWTGSCPSWRVHFPGDGPLLGKCNWITLVPEVCFSSHLIR